MSTSCRFTLAILPAFFFAFSPWSHLHAAAWTQTSAPYRQWTSLAGSADGKILVAAGSSQVFVSTNSGNAWVATGNTGSVVAASARGERLLVLNGSQIYVSPDQGITWTSNTTPSPFSALAAASDGRKLVASDGTLLYTSTNAGVSWTQRGTPINRPWRRLASSADGAKLVASFDDKSRPGTYRSTDSGATWSYLTSFSFGGMGGVAGVASSADGTKLAVSGGYGATSTNSGASWTGAGVALFGLSSVAISADGEKMFFTDPYHALTWYSFDSGVSWWRTDGPRKEFMAVTVTADGSRLTVAEREGGIYVSQTANAPPLRVASSGDSLRLAWTVPSTVFVLQENSDLATTNWTEVTAAPTLDYTNLQYSVTIPASSGARFYRLGYP